MTESARYDFAVIGTGPAGKRAAIEAAKSGQRVVAVDLEQYIGGQAVHRGTIPSKTLGEAVLHVTGIAQIPDIQYPDLITGYSISRTRYLRFNMPNLTFARGPPFQVNALVVHLKQSSTCPDSPKSQAKYRIY